MAGIFIAHLNIYTIIKTYFQKLAGKNGSQIARSHWWFSWAEKRTRRKIAHKHDHRLFQSLIPKIQIAMPRYFNVNNRRYLFNFSLKSYIYIQDTISQKLISWLSHNWYRNVSNWWRKNDQIWQKKFPAGHAKFKIWRGEHLSTKHYKKRYVKEK